MMQIDREQADALLTTTRAVRRRLNYDRPVEREVIQDCVQIALQAPVGHRTWKRHFVVIMDPEQRKRVADVYRKDFYPYLEQVEIDADEAAKVDPEREKLLRGNLALSRQQADTLHQVPCLVLVGIEGRVENKPPYDQASAYGSVIPAAWSFMMALRARGLGACWTTLHIPNEADAARILGMPEDITHATLLPVAYYTGETFKAGQRLPTREQIHWDNWGQHD